MLDGIVIGQYVPGKSPLHGINPAFKIILALLYAALLFCVNTAGAYALFIIFTALMIKMSGVPARLIIKGMKPVIWILIFTAVLNLFLTDGKELFSLFHLTITYEGARMALLLTVRILLLIAGTSLLTLTTPPLMLTDGIEALLKPFRKLKVPSHEIAMMMTIAIRFIPTLAGEADKIMKAQKARGADFGSGGLIKRAKALVPLLIPLLVGAFRRADELAEAMEARCYRGGDGRTGMKETHMTASDAKAGAVYALGAAAIILAEIFGRIYLV